jgi:hypothetical protein
VRTTPERYWSWVTGQFRDGDPTYYVSEGWSDQIERFESPPCVQDETGDAALVLSTGCQASMGAGFGDGETRDYYDGSGRWVAGLRLRREDLALVTVGVEGKTLRVKGGGCDLSVPLAK